MFGRVSARTHYLDKPGLGPPGKQIWEFDDPTLLEFPPVLYKERLYLADKAGDVRALDATNGKVIWNRQRVNSQGRGSVPADVTAPTFAGDVLVVAFEPGEVIALEPAEGKLEWSTEVALGDAVIVGVEDGKIHHEHVYWDQASLPVQIGLLDTDRLPATGAEQASRLLELGRSAAT